MRTMMVVWIAAAFIACGGSEQTVTETTNTAPATPATTSAAPPPAAATPAVPAESVVKELYAAKESPFFQSTDRALVDRYFEPALAEMIWKDAQGGEVGAVGFDPLYDAQDMEIKNLVIARAQDGQVVVTFENFSKPQRIVYSVVDVAGAWKISEIHYAEGHTLRGLYERAAAS